MPVDDETCEGDAVKIRLDRDVMAEAVAWAARSLPTRPSVPILAGLLVKADAQGVTLSIFDYETSAQIHVKAEVMEQGEALVSGRLLADIARSLPSRPVELTSDESKMELVCGSARFTLQTLPVADYPNLPDMPAAEFGRRLVAYVLRNRLQIGVWSELHVSGTFESSQAPAGIISGSWQDKSLELDLTVGDIGRSLHISTTQSDIHSEASAAWAMSSLIAGIPSLGLEQVEKWTPQQLGLQRLNAFSVKKGCYPGQEIVARTHFLGKNKRELIRVDNDAIDSIPAESVVCHSQLGDDRIALIVS